ncbi:MAG: SRPBCC family protein [FCB group bacterium]|nr:SRPBCC family protein [FCB group bacterium]
MNINESILIEQAPQKIWDFWLLVTEDIHWRDGFTKAEWTSPPPFGTGSTGVHYHKDLGAMKWEITRYEDGRFFEFIHRAGRLKGSTAYFEVAPEGPGSRVAVRAKISGPLPMRFMMLFMGAVMKKGMQDDLQKLKELMEKEDSKV